MLATLLVLSVMPNLKNNQESKSTKASIDMLKMPLALLLSPSFLKPNKFAIWST